MNRANKKGYYEKVKTCNNDFRLQLPHELNKGLIKISDLDHFNSTVLKVLDN